MNKFAAEKPLTSARWRQRVAYDLAYIERWSLRLDFLILLRTVREVIAPANVY